ncbi:NAD(P)-binding protein [Trichoderma evansii]
MASRSKNTVVIIGSGPGIGSQTAAVFVSKRFDKVALIARNTEQLQKDANAIVGAAAGEILVKTYSVDISDSNKFTTTLQQISNDLGTPEFVLVNAAIVATSSFFEFSEEHILKDFYISTISLYHAAAWAILQLTLLARQDPIAKPTLMVTNSNLPETPIVDLFSLSLSKASQKNLTLSLRQKFGPQGIHICLLTVAGGVADGHPNLNSKNIANKAWKLYNQQKNEWTEDIIIQDP